MTTTPTQTPPGEEREEPSSRHRGHGQARNPAGKIIVWVLAALLLALATVQLPNIGWFLGVKAFALETVGVVLAVFVVSRGEWTWERVRAALVSGPNPFILAFLAWVGISAARSPLPMFSAYEALRHLGGGLVYFGVAYGLSPRRNLGQIVGLLSFAGFVASLVAFQGFGGTLTSAGLAGAFRNGQLLAAFLCLMFPLVLVAAMRDEVPWRRIASQVALIAVAAGLLVARNRSAWAGCVVAGAVVLGLYLRYGLPSGGPDLHRSKWVVPILMVALSIGLFLMMSRSGLMIQERAGSLVRLTEDTSFRQRLGMWDKARRMIRDRPLTGWGVGLFAMEQARYYHKDVPTFQQIKVFRYGSTMWENAHNTYLQTAAELGIPGAVLYVSIFIAFFVTALRALPRQRQGFRQMVLIGAIAAIAAQIVAGIGSPAWEYPECSLILWLVMGIGMAAAGLGSRGTESDGDA